MVVCAAIVTDCEGIHCIIRWQLSVLPFLHALRGKPIPSGEMTIDALPI